jgi:uncharacterized membrane protein
MLRTSLALWAVAAVVLVPLAGLLRGGAGALSALTAAGVVAAFFTVGHIGVKAVLSGEVGLSLAGAFVVYLGQLIALVFILLVLRRAGWVDGPTFAVVAIVATLVWQVGLVIGFRRGRHEVYPDVTLPKAGP